MFLFSSVPVTIGREIVVNRKVKVKARDNQFHGPRAGLQYGIVSHYPANCYVVRLGPGKAGARQMVYRCGPSICGSWADEVV